jgi:hypothetical protein
MLFGWSGRWPARRRGARPLSGPRRRHASIFDF